MKVLVAPTKPIARQVGAIIQDFLYFSEESDTCLSILKGGLGGNWTPWGFWRHVSFGEHPSDEAENGTGHSLMSLDDKLGRFGLKGGGRRAETCTRRKKRHFRPANSIEKNAKT